MKKLNYKQVISWGLYDFANTIFSAIVVTVYLPLYLTHLTGKSSYFGVAVTVSMIFSGIFVPFAGSLSDKTGKCKYYLVNLIILTVICTLSLSFIGNPYFLIIIFFIANVAYQVSLVFYNALLSLISTEKTMGLVSGIGVGLGYLGVIVALPIALFVYSYFKSEFLKPVKVELKEITTFTLKLARCNLERKSEEARIYINKISGLLEQIARKLNIKLKPDLKVQEKLKRIKSYIELNAEKYTFLVAGILLFIFSVPLMKWVPELKTSFPAQKVTIKLLKASVAKTIATVKTLPERKTLLFFLLGNFFAVDALNTSIAFFSVYLEKVFQTPKSELTYLLLALNLAAFIFGFILGFYTDKVGTKKSYLFSVACLIFTLAIAVFSYNKFVVYITLIFLGGIGISGIWVTGRKFLYELADKNAIGEYFGLYGLTGKLSSFGCLLFGIIADTLSYRHALAFQIITSSAGFILIALINRKPLLKESDY